VLTLSKIGVTKKPSPTIARPEKALRTVPYESGFHFFTGIGNYTGVTAVSLFEFAEKLQTVPIESVTFHFQRGDFQKWVKNTLGDDEAAKRIDELKKWSSWSSEEKLRKDLLKAVEKRLAELKSLS
jgi:alpha-amylase